MKILNPRSALLSDFEVLLLLKEMEDQQHDAKAAADLSQASLEQGLAKVPDNLRTVQYATMSTLCQPSRACLYQTPDHLQGFHTALKKAGFIGGRRGVNSGKQRQVDEHDVIEEDAADEDFAPTSSKAKKRRSTIGSSARKSKRAKQDREDPAMKSPAPEGDSRVDFDYNSDERGPEEILPDRALTKAERLMLVNQVPRNLVELHTLVEELEMRFTEGQITELLHLIHAHLPLPLTDDEANDPNAQQPAAPTAGDYDDEDDMYNMQDDTQEGPVDWDTLEMNSHKTTATQSNGAGNTQDASMTADQTAPLFMGGDEEEEDDHTGLINGDEDEWVNEHVGRGGDDDLAGPGGDDDE